MFRQNPRLSRRGTRAPAEFPRESRHFSRVRDRPPIPHPVTGRDHRPYPATPTLTPHLNRDR